MSVFRIQGDCTFFEKEHQKDYYNEIIMDEDDSLKNPLLHEIDITTLKAKIKNEKLTNGTLKYPNFTYGGGFIFAAKIKFQGFSAPDYSLIYLAFDKNDTTTVLNKPGDWAILLCPLGNINQTTKSAVYDDCNEFRLGIYGEIRILQLFGNQIYAPSFISALLQKGEKTEALGKIDNFFAELHSNIGHEELSQLNIPKLIPSKTSLSKDFLNAGLKAPSMEELDLIFQGTNTPTL